MSEPTADKLCFARLWAGGYGAWCCNPRVNDNYCQRHQTIKDAFENGEKKGTLRWFGDVRDELLMGRTYEEDGSSFTLSPSKILKEGEALPTERQFYWQRTAEEIRNAGKFFYHNPFVPIRDFSCRSEGLQRETTVHGSRTSSAELREGT
jgi:hypothetical protein